MSLDVYLKVVKPTTIYTSNITHNLSTMAKVAGIYEALWRPDEMQPPITKAAQLIPVLKAGLVALVSTPGLYRAYEPDNGWGSYDGLVKFVRDYILACEENPDADVEVSR